MNVYKRFALSMLLGAIFLSACAPGSEFPFPVSTPADGTPSDDVVIPDTGLPPVVGEVARQWLSEQLNIPIDSIVIQSFEPAEWTDSCLGLGGPAEGCLQVITPGWRAVFLVNGQAYEVRLDETGQTIRRAILDATPAEIPTLTGTKWVLISFGEGEQEVPVLSGSNLTLEFQDGGLATGAGGCNTFGTQYEQIESRLVFEAIETTEIACSEAGVMEQEQRYYQSLEAADAFELHDHQLRIWSTEQSSVLTFVLLSDVTPTPPPAQSGELVNTQWTLESFGPVGAEMPVVTGSTITLEFQPDGQAVGSGGCNQYGALYRVQADTITFGQINSTLRACSEEQVNQQERRYFEALQTATNFQLGEGRLQITFGEEGNVLNFVQGKVSQETGQPIQIQQIQMIDAQNGWALGEQTPDRLGLILSTSDGGATWTNRTPADIPSPQASPFNNPPDAFFASGREAWVVYPAQPGQEAPMAPLIWFTQDGGQTWNTSQPLEVADLPLDYFIPSNLEFLDGFGWMLAHLGVGMSHDYIAIFTTNDGGQTWQRVADPSQSGDIQSCPKSGLVFTSPNEGWLTGNCPGLMPTLFFYHTTDGGVTWTPAELPAPEGFPVDSRSMGDSCGITQISRVLDTLKLIFQCLDLEQSTARAWIYTSADAGLSWHSFALPLPSDNFVFVSDKEGWLYGAAVQEEGQGHTTLFYTLDGGQTWQELTQVANVAQLEFVDSQTGWIVSSDGSILLYSSDGGQNWQEIRPVMVE